MVLLTTLHIKFILFTTFLQGRDHPYRVFLKIGEQIFDISFRFFAISIFILLFAENSRFLVIFGKEPDKN